jgi:YHS domain-containing protein
MFKQLVMVLSLITFFGFVALAQEKPETENVTKEVTEKEKQECMKDSHSCCGKHEMHSDMKSEGTSMNSIGEKNETANAQPWNKVCPVKGNEIDPEARTVEYNGKLYGFCCTGCGSKFQKDPEKYMKNLNEDGSEFIKKS